MLTLCRPIRTGKCILWQAAPAALVTACCHTWTTGPTQLLTMDRQVWRTSMMSCATSGSVIGSTPNKSADACTCCGMIRVSLPAIITAMGRDSCLQAWACSSSLGRKACSSLKVAGSVWRPDLNRWWYLHSARVVHTAHQCRRGSE